MGRKYSVLLILEGTYPFNGGGVSTWAHMLCNQVSNVEYILYSINADYESESKYILSENVKEVVQVPLWSPLEPQELISYEKKFYKFIDKKEFDDVNTAIEDQFVPLFKKMIESIYDENRKPKEFDVIIYQMWEFFQKHDYKKTMRSLKVWNTFCRTISEIIQEKENISLYDLTVGMRWLYRFLIPLSIDIPKADISHLTISGFPVIPALVLKFKYGTPLIATEHGVFIRERLLAINTSEYSFFLKKLLINLSEAITELVYLNADLILSVNKFNIKWEKMYGAYPDKIDIIYNGIDHQLFVPASKPQHLEGIPTVVAAARIFELKDILTMIRSCDVVRKEIPNVKYLVYGDNNAVPEYTAQCDQLIDELGLRENFFLAGFHSKPHLIFSEGDISILTSISEGFPYTVLESMSCGVPVVATDVGGVTEALDESCGFICKPKDHEEIGAKVIELLKNKELRKQMGICARQKILDNFTIENFIHDYEKAYEKVMSDRKGKSDKIIELTISQKSIINSINQAYTK